MKLSRHPRSRRARRSVDPRLRGRWYPGADWAAFKVKHPALAAAESGGRSPWAATLDEALGYLRERDEAAPLGGRAA